MGINSDFKGLKTRGYLLPVSPAITLKNTKPFPHRVFICFVWISKQTAIISLYSVNWLVLTTEMVCVHCAVRSESLNTIKVHFRLQGVNTKWPNSW